MKRFYYIFPVVLLVAFSLTYMQFSKSSDAAEQAKAAKIAQAKLAEEHAKEEAEAKARADSERRTAQRVAEEKAKEAEKEAKWQAESQKLAEETQKYVSATAELSTQAKSLEKQLKDLRAAREQRTRDLLNASTEVEETAVTKHNAEMEIQRMTEMLVRKATKTSLVKE